MAVPAAHDIDKLGRAGIVLVHAHAQQVDHTLLVFLQQQVERHRVVDIISHVGLENHGLTAFARRGRRRRTHPDKGQKQKKSLHNVCRLQVTVRLWVGCRLQQACCSNKGNKTSLPRQAARQTFFGFFHNATAAGSNFPYGKDHILHTDNTTMRPLL